MLRSTNSLIGYRILATDGVLGKVKDLYFDDRTWTARYLVADTGGWLEDRLVLISPVDVGTPDWSKDLLPVSLSKKQVEESPPAAEDQPVSRRYEQELSAHFGWPFYWVATPGGIPGQAAVESAAEQPEEPSEGDSNLRSAREVTGYHIQATDGEIGHVEDMIIDTDPWIIRYLVIDTKNWLPGRKVLVARNWLNSVSWEEHKVHVDLNRNEIKGSPEYDPAKPVNRDYETRLYDYYGRPSYWR